jgi:hypothetical protein
MHRSSGGTSLELLPAARPNLGTGRTGMLCAEKNNTSTVSLPTCVYFYLADLTPYAPLL